MKIEAAVRLLPALVAAALLVVIVRGGEPGSGRGQLRPRLPGEVAKIIDFARAVKTEAPREALNMRTGPLVSTYSIVARDPETGEMGVAVQSHWFRVGPLVAWAEAGIGAVATQSFVEVSYGPKGLALMRAGVAAPAALDVLVQADAQRDVRQVAMIDAEGRVSTWTGPRCIAEAGHRAGDQYSVQANLMEKDTVWGAMSSAYERTAGRPLAERLMAALDAAEAEGGDMRGRQSAALRVVKSEASGRPWNDVVVDLRVDDHMRPLAELRRLYELDRAYKVMNEGDAALADGRVEEAAERFREASRLAGENVELPFWQAISLYAAGEERRALQIFARVFDKEPRWREVVRRLPAAGLLPGKADVEAILAAGEKPSR